MTNSARALVNRRDFVRSGLLIASACACAPRVFGETLHGQARPGVADQTNSWTIGNERIKRTIAYHPKTGLFTEQFSGLSTHADFVLSGKTRIGQEFSFLCNGHSCAGANPMFDLLRADHAALPNGNSLTIRLLHKELPLEVSVVYSVYDGHPAIRKHLVLRNTGDSPLHISHLNIEALGLALGPANETTLLTQYGTVPRETFYTGRSEDAGLLVANSLTGNGIAVLSEVPGYMKRTEIDGFYDPRSRAHRRHVRHRSHALRAHPRRRRRIHHRLRLAGRLIAMATASTIHTGCCPPTPRRCSSAASTRRVRRGSTTPGSPSIATSITTWCLQLVDAAGAMGMDIFTIDDGWQQEYGENAVNLTAFPGGLQPILDAVEAKGMRLGLWIPLAAIGTSTADYREHPEWAALDQEGKPKITGTAAGAKGVMCMATPYRDAAAARIIDAIERFHLAYVKLDLTTIFNAYGEAPGCWAKGHYHGNWAESLNMIYEGIAYVTAKIYQKHPDVLLDLTFELWGQKHIIDAGLLAAGDLDWMSNVDDGQPDSAGPRAGPPIALPARRIHAGREHAHRQHARGAAHHSGEPLPPPSVRRPCCSAICASSAPPTAVVPRKNRMVQKAAPQHENQRKLFPARQLAANHRQPHGTDLRASTHNGNGVIALFRNKSNAASATIQLPLIPEAKYKLTSVITGKDLGYFEKSDWVHGIEIKFANKQPVEILEVTPVTE